MFICDRLAETDASGRLAMTGVEWTEGSRDLNYGIGMCLLVLSGAGIMLILNHSSIWPEMPGLSLVAGIAALSSWYWASKFDFSRLLVRRCVRFLRDGTVEGPPGARCNGLYAKEMSERHADIVSIETRMSPPKPVGKDERPPLPFYEIVVFMRNGDTWIVGGDLEQDEAHKVAVELTHALTAIRETLSAMRVGTGTRAKHSVAELRIH